MSERKIDDKAAVDQAESLMNDFAQRTGLASNAEPVRYLWTDAFAVCNFLALSKVQDEGEYLDLARWLVKQVHSILGRHRDDDSRKGWISGLSEGKGASHPASGGLRIGKKLPESDPVESSDARLEWDCDGQYFHYLTRWMQALDALARETGELKYLEWAAELAEASGNAFVYRDQAGQLKMYWKMSIDLSRPLVLSAGPHDPLDGYISTLQLRAAFTEMGEPAGKSDSGNEFKPDKMLASFAEIIRGRDWITADPLGLGILLINATRLMRLIHRGFSSDIELLKRVLGSAQIGLGFWKDSKALNQPASQRLAFRELGLAIGLGDLRIMGENGFAENSIGFELNELDRFLRLENHITAFWADKNNHQNQLWKEHLDINEVMLAAALLARSSSTPILV